MVINLCLSIDVAEAKDEKFGVIYAVQFRSCGIGPRVHIPQLADRTAENGHHTSPCQQMVLMGQVEIPVYALN